MATARRMKAAKIEDGIQQEPIWLRNMNPEQRDAILHLDGPCALLAVAGAGKTRAVVHRIARMVVECDVPGERILAVTFSKKAADEMNDRLDKIARELRINIDARIGTWHSLCLQILKEDHTHWGSWEIDEKDAAKWIIKDVVGYRHLDWKEADLTKLRSFIGWCKANLWDVESEDAMNYAMQVFGTRRDFSGRPAFQLALDTFRKSQEILEERGLLTFDDFLVYTHRHLSDEYNRGKWAGKWSYLIQDEAQDANKAQKVIAELLARDHRNYMVVGDTAQAIYGFRGTTPKYLADFANEWNAKTIIMNRNYRSGSKIIDAANNVIRPAEVKLPVDMIAEAGIEGSAAVKQALDFDDEANEFAAWVFAHQQTGGKLADITCLFRLNAQSRALEEALLKRRIPYQLIGGRSFYDRREVKDLLAYLRVATNSDREGDGIKRCINAPFRFLGARFVDRVMEEARAAGFPRESVNWVEIAQSAARQEGVQGRQRQSVAEWATLMAMVAERVGQEGQEPKSTIDANPGKILGELVNKTRYIEWLEKEEGSESVESSSSANVRELIRVAEKFSTVKELLNYIELTQAAAKKQRRGDKGDRVLLMSIHRSKGLEWPKLWVVGCNESILPHVKGEPEEERRLAYVAITRAKEELVLSFVTSFATRGGIQQGQASRFLSDAGLRSSEI